MHTRNLSTFLAAALPTLCLGTAALGGDSLPITIINDNPEVVLVTVYDMNVQPPAAILSGVQIAGFASIPLTITPGPEGYGHIAWTATSADSFSRQCGHLDRPGLSNDVVVHVYAKSECSPPPQ
jgi:hypothetical protein